MKYFIKNNLLLLIMLLLGISIGCNLFDKGTNVTVSEVGGVEGIVTNKSNGNAISGVLVRIGNASIETNSNGVYSLNNIDVGSRTITADKSGYGPYSGEVQITKGSIITSNIELSALSNSAPIADAGDDQNVISGSTVTLDGRRSYDPNGDVLTYLWAFVSTPGGSTAAFSDRSAINPTFIPNVNGTYEINLTVSDGLNTASDKVKINVSTSFSLVAYYPFDGNANDKSGNGNNGTVHGATLTTDRFGNDNSAYSFNGTNNYVVVSNPSGLPVGNADRTMCAWFKTSVSNNLALFLMSYGSSGNNLACGLYVENGKLIYSSWGMDANIYGSGSNIADNNWHHAVVTHSSSTGNVMYIDGVAVGKNTAAFATSSGTKFQIGLWVNNTNYFNGIIDDVRIYNRAFSESEVKELYNSGL